MDNDRNNDLQQKYQLLAAEFAKVRAQCGVLKKAVVDEQKKNEQLQCELNESNQLNRKNVQEIDSLCFRNQQLTKRVEALQSEAEKGSRQSSAKESRGRIAPQNASDDTSVLRRELELRITENESLHAKLLETENSCRQRIAEAENKLQAIKRVSESSENALLSLRAARDKELDRLNEIVSIQEIKLQEKDRIIDALSQKYEASKQRIEALERELIVARERLPENANHVAPSQPSVPQTQTKVDQRQQDAKANEASKRLDLKSTVNEAQFLADLREHVGSLVDTFSSWLPADTPSREDSCTHSEVTSLFGGSDWHSSASETSRTTSTDSDSLSSLLDSAATYLLFKLLPSLRTLHSALKQERDAIRQDSSAAQSTISLAASSSKHAKLIASKLDNLLHCVHSLTAVGVRCSADLLGAGATSTEAAMASGVNDSLVARTVTEAHARPLAIAALVQAVTDAHVLARRYSKLHSQRVSLLYAALRSNGGVKRDGGLESDSFASFCDRLEAEQIAMLNCENALETLLNFLKQATTQSDGPPRSLFAFSSASVAAGNDVELLALDDSAVELGRASQPRPKTEPTTAAQSQPATATTQQSTQPVAMATANSNVSCNGDTDSNMDNASVDTTKESKRSSGSAKAHRADADLTLKVETLQTQTRLLEAQLRECVKRLQLAEAHKRSSLVQLLAGPNAASAVADVRTFYEEAVARLSEHVQAAHARAVHFAAELSAARAQLRVAARRLGSQADELTLVRTKYEQQLAAMSDHLAELNIRVAAQHDELGTLRRRAAEPARR